MKLPIFFASIFATALSFGGVDTIALFPERSVPVQSPSKVLAIRALSPVADGTATVKVESRHFTNAMDIVSVPFTNEVFELVWSNGTSIATNSSPREADLMPLPTDGSLISYLTNRTVTIYSTTNHFQALALCVTNNLADELTCSGGYATSSPSGKVLIGGDRVFYEGTASGRVEIVIER